MKKLLRARDILLLTLAGIGDVAQEVKDPMRIMGTAYENMYGFIPRRYKRSNFLQTVKRSLKTQDIERIVKNGKTYLRLTSSGKSNVKRDFPITNLIKSWNGHWVILVFDISEKSRVVRDRFRIKLKNLGFGMLQKSVWISPLPIGQDMKEFVDSIGLSQDIFVMEVSGFVFGDPKELARRVWRLDRLEGEYFELKTRVESINQLVKKHNDRGDKNKAKVKKPYDKAYDKPYGKAYDKSYLSYLYSLKRQKRIAMRELLEFYVTLPSLPQELLPKSFREGLVFRFS